MDSPFARASGQPSPISPEDERKAATIAGLCDTYLKERGFRLVQVGPDYAMYQNKGGYQIAVRGHLWSCKPPNDKEFSGVGYADLEIVIRGS